LIGLATDKNSRRGHATHGSIPRAVKKWLILGRELETYDSARQSFIIEAIHDTLNSSLKKI